MQKPIMLEDLGFETGNRYVAIDPKENRIVMEGTFTPAENDIIMKVAAVIFAQRVVWTGKVHEYKSR